MHVVGPKTGERCVHTGYVSSQAAPSPGGQALDKHTQATMSARFGHDFSSVRIHTDARAEESAEAMDANAYAHGSDIVFGAGKYQPGSPETERLLAHELIHVVQQARFGAGDRTRTSRRGDASEREADALSTQILSGRTVQVQSAPSAAIARDEDPPDPADTPSVREKDKPGGPTDWGDKGLSLKWGWDSWLPKSADVDPGMGDPLTVPNPFAPKPTPKLGPPPSTEFLPRPTPDPAPAMPLSDPTNPSWLPPPAPSGGGLLGQPYDPSRPYGDPSTWQPSAVAPGPF